MEGTMTVERIGVRIKGIVQGVGFRPFVYRLAKQYQLSGFVLNDEQGVWLEIQGDIVNIDRFKQQLSIEAPPLADIVAVNDYSLPLSEERNFIIRDSRNSIDHQTLISPDIATCTDCQKDIADPNNRRFRYAFTNCTNCGPRYSIVKDVPYDRIKTTMRDFRMCEQCLVEYKNVEDRRFHAQPNACAICGPKYNLFDSNWREVGGDALAVAAQYIRKGAIVAIKGIGGYHLVCNARNDAVVNRLRLLKGRAAKPLAVMCASIKEAMKISKLSELEKKLLGSIVRPIVLLEKSSGYDLAAAIAPHTQYIGVMLPYAPVHFIMMEQQDVWVMTSGNHSELPLIYQDSEAKISLHSLADFFLMHNRSIQCRVDDSVARIFHGAPYLIRRSRGMAPAPIHLAKTGEAILAVGGEQKNTFCLTNSKDAFVSAHIGDLENMAVFASYQELIKHDQRLFGINPKVVACDLHPEYLSTKYAKDLKLPIIAVQHHHAHIASVLLEHGESDPVIGVAFDGTGYGIDGKLWGGEFMIADCCSFQRIAQFTYLPLPGGAQAISQPWRQAAWVLRALYGDKFNERDFLINRLLPDGWELVLQAADAGLNSPLTSSAGRIFDTAAALLGLRSVNQYSGQAAVELELKAKNTIGKVLPYDLINSKTICIDFSATFAAIAERAAKGVLVEQLAADFHTTMADVVVTMVRQISNSYKIKKVALSGGVFQNILLLKQVIKGLNHDFTILLNRQVPPNDGGLSLGQAGVARERVR